MTSTRRRTAARGSGTSIHFSADPISRTRLDFCIVVLARVLGIDASQSTVIRRALALYADSLTAVIEAQDLAATVPDHKLNENADPKALRAKLAHSSERVAITKASKGDFRTISREQLEEGPVRPFKQLLAGPRGAADTVADMIRRDLARWAAEAAPASINPQEPPQ